MHLSHGLFLTGTGTDIGKTYVSALIIKALRDFGIDAGYYKAAISGIEHDENGAIKSDATFVAAMAGLSETHEDLVSFSYENAVSPHLAAHIEGNPLDLDTVVSDFKKSAESHDYILMEGSGGIVCPLRYDKDEQIMLEDVIVRLGLDVLIVADAGLGTLNAIMTTCAYLEKVGILARGLILNNFEAGNIMHEDNLTMARKLSGLPIVGTVPHQENDDQPPTAALDPKALIPLFKPIHL